MNNLQQQVADYQAATGGDIAAAASTEFYWPNTTYPTRRKRMRRVVICNAAASPGVLNYAFNASSVTVATCVGEIAPGETLTFTFELDGFLIESVALFSTPGHTYKTHFWVNGLE